MERDDSSGDITRLLANWGAGDQQACEDLIRLVYGELRSLASGYLRRERPGHTLQATALVHEAFLRLAGQEDVSFRNRHHFFGAAAQAMRRILVDHARSRLAEKRGSGFTKVALTEAIVMSQEQPAQLLALHESLDRLAAMDPQQARIVELRVFAGLTVEEAAEVVGISTATVKRDWALAKTWLVREIGTPETS